MSKDNLCVVLKKKGDLRLENQTIPEPLPNEVLISMGCVGICGSDVHFWKDGRIGDFIVREPLVLGHESSGTIVKVGCGVKHLKKGDRVCIEPCEPCGKCELCRKGRYNICPSLKFCATPPTDGSLCNFYCHDANFCYKLPDHMSLEEGAMLEPLSVAVFACQKAEVTPGKSVLICGAGPIGLLNFLTCKAMGISNICITDISQDRLNFAKNLGATKTVCVKNAATEKEQIENVIIQLDGQPDITIECSGAEASVRLGIKVTKSGGVLMLVGVGPLEVKIPLIEATCREIDIRSIIRYANCYPAALELVASGKVNVKSLITHHFKMEDALKAFETASAGTGLKIMIHCSK